MMSQDVHALLDVCPFGHLAHEALDHLLRQRVAIPIAQYPSALQMPALTERVRQP